MLRLELSVVVLATAGVMLRIAHLPTIDTVTTSMNGPNGAILCCLGLVLADDAQDERLGVVGWVLI